MLTAIIVYLIIGAITVLSIRNALADAVKHEDLPIKIMYYIAMIVIAVPGIIYGFLKGAYQEFKNKSES